MGTNTAVDLLLSLLGERKPAYGWVSPTFFVFVLFFLHLASTKRGKRDLWRYAEEESGRKKNTMDKT